MSQDLSVYSLTSTMVLKVLRKIALKINRCSEKEQANKILWSKILGKLWVKRNTAGLFTVGPIKGLGLLQHLYESLTEG